VYLLPNEFSWYIFYFIPKSFNASLIRTRSMQVDISLGQVRGYEGEENLLIEEMKKNMDPQFTS
jgi:hypothetical protein